MYWNGHKRQNFKGFQVPNGPNGRFCFVPSDVPSKVGALHLGLSGAGGGQKTPIEQGQRERCLTAGEGREVQHRARQRLGWDGFLDGKNGSKMVKMGQNPQYPQYPKSRLQSMEEKMLNRVPRTDNLAGPFVPQFWPISGGRFWRMSCQLHLGIENWWVQHTSECWLNWIMRISGMNYGAFFTASAGTSQKLYI